MGVMMIALAWYYIVGIVLASLLILSAIGVYLMYGPRDDHYNDKGDGGE